MPTGVLAPLLRTNPNFRRYFIGQSVSLLGDQITLIALPLTAVLALHATAGQMGALTTAYLVPNLLLALHAGAWVDRSGGRRSVMLATDIGRALLIGSDARGVRLRAPDLDATLRRRVPDRIAERLLLRRVRRVHPDAGAARGLRPGELADPRQPCLLVPRRQQRRRHPRATAARAVRTRRRRVLVSLVGTVPRAHRRSKTRQRAPQRVRRLDWQAHAGSAANAVIRAELLGVATLNFFNFIFFALFLLYATRSPARFTSGTRARARRRLDRDARSARSSPPGSAAGIGVGRAFTLGCFLFPAPLILVPARRPGRTGSCSRSSSLPSSSPASA